MGDVGTLTMSTKDLNRLEVLGRVLERRLTQRSAAERLGLCLRQVERLCRALRKHGAAGLVSRKCGCPSNHKLQAGVGFEPWIWFGPGIRISVPPSRARSCASSTT